MSYGDFFCNAPALNPNRTLITGKIYGIGDFMRKNLTELVFILDRSGSMQGLEGDTISGVPQAAEEWTAVICGPNR